MHDWNTFLASLCNTNVNLQKQQIVELVRRAVEMWFLRFPNRHDVEDTKPLDETSMVKKIKQLTPTTS